MSTIFQSRTDFFQSMAVRNKRIAHTKNGKVSFARINDMEEFDALVSTNVNWGQPFLVHLGFSFTMKSLENVTVDKNITNAFCVLTKKGEFARADKEQAAKDDALDVVWQCLSFIRENNAMDVDGSPCAFQFKNIDWDTCRITEIGPINNEWYGWEVSFTDESSADSEIAFDDNKWYPET